MHVMILLALVKSVQYLPNLEAEIFERYHVKSARNSSLIEGLSIHQNMWGKRGNNQPDHPLGS